MKQKILGILNVKASESKQVFDLLSVQFFIGLATAFLNIIAFSLFIYNFSIDKLPYVYLIIALLMVIVNIVYEKLEHTYSPLTLLKLVISIAAFLLLVLWAGLTFGNKHDFIFVLLVFNTLIYMLTGYAFWGLVSLLFNVRESRRVFSIVGSGDIPSKLIGYIVAPLLIPLIGLSNLIWLAVISLGVSLYLFNKVIKKRRWDDIRKRSSHTHHSHKAHGKTNLVTFFFENKLIFTISLLSILSYNVFVLIDYTFISQVKLKFDNISDLALYIAAFFAIGRIIALAFKLIFTSRVIEKLGIISCLFLTPIALFLFCLLFFIYEGHANYNVFIFGMMALLTEVLRSTMQEPVFFILFQPLKEKLRLKGHIIAKGYTLPPSLLVVGGSLLALFKWGFSLTILFTIKIIIINLLVWGAVIFLIKVAYLNTLHNSIKKGIYSGDDKNVYDDTAIEILLNKVATGKSSEIIYSLELLKKADYPKLNELFQQQLFSPVAEIKRYALSHLEAVPGNTDIEALQKLLKTEHDPEIKNKIIAVLCKKDPAFLETLAESMEALDNDTRKTVIINLMNQAEFHHLLRAGNEMNRLIQSANPEERILALNIITQLKNVQFTKVISELMNDEDAHVRRNAVAAAGKLKINSLLPQILSIANDKQEKYLVINALQQYGDKLFADIKFLPVADIANYTPDLVKIATNIKGDHCKEFLLNSMSAMDFQTGKTINALWSQNYEPYDAAAIDKFHHLLNSYLQLGIAKAHDYQDMPAYQFGKEIIKTSLLNEVKTDLVISLKLCSMIFKKKQINRILELVDIDNNQKLFNAMEVIEMELPKKIAKELIYLFDFILDPDNLKADSKRPLSLPVFEKVYDSDAFSYNPWTKAIMIYNSWKNHVQEELEIIYHKKVQQPHFMVTETRNFVLHTKN